MLHVTMFKLYKGLALFSSLLFKLELNKPCQNETITISSPFQIFNHIVNAMNIFFLVNTYFSFAL